MKNHYFLFGAVCILFVSCASLRHGGSKINPVYVTNTKQFNLLPPDDIQNPKNVQQFLSGTYGETEFGVLCYLDADENGIFLSLFNDFGTGLGNFSYDGERVLFESTVFPKNTKAEYIIADLQYAYYSADALKARFNEAGLDFVTDEIEVSGEFREVRKILDGKKIIEEIEISNRNVKIRNFLRNYTYYLEEAE